MNVVSIAEIIISHPSFFVGITAHTMLIMDVIVKNISICLSSSFCIYVFYDDFMGIFLVLCFCDIYHVEHSCLLARRADLQAAHWYVESSLSTIDAAKAAFYPDINLMAFLQQDALHLSDLFRHSAQQMGVTAGLTLPIFDSGRLNANLDIAKAESNLSIASYNKAVVEAVNDVARAASQVQTLAEKNQHQAQIERDALRVVGLAQARFNAGIIAGSRVSEARIPALRERANGLLLQGQWLDASIQLTGALGGGYKR